MTKLNLTDSKGNELKVGDKVVYCRSISVGFSNYQDLSIGVVEGETKRKVKIFDESELNFDWRNIPNKTMKMHFRDYHWDERHSLNGHHLCNIERILKIS